MWYPPTGKISVAAFPHLHLVTTLDVGRSAKDLAFSPDGRAAYVLDPADHEVVFLDCEGGSGNPPEGAIPRVAFRLRLGGALADLALSPDGKTLVAASSTLTSSPSSAPRRASHWGLWKLGSCPAPW